MAQMSAESRQRLKDTLLASFDEDDAGTMDLFVQNYLHNARMWDMIAEGFPDATATTVKQVMMEAYGAWEKERKGEAEA